MKYLLMFLLLVSSASYAKAQDTTSIAHMLATRANPENPGMPAKEVIKHIGTDVYVRDSIYSYKAVNPSLTLLFLGGQYPNHKLTIFIKGKKLNKQLTLIRTGIGHFSGKALLHKGKPALIVTHSIQSGTRILI